MCFGGCRTRDLRSVNGQRLQFVDESEQKRVRQSSGTFIPRSTARVSAYCNSCNCMLVCLLQLFASAATASALGIHRPRARHQSVMSVGPLFRDVRWPSIRREALYFEASRHLTLQRLTGKILTEETVETVDTVDRTSSSLLHASCTSFCWTLKGWVEQVAWGWMQTPSRVSVCVCKVREGAREGGVSNCSEEVIHRNQSRE